MKRITTHPGKKYFTLNNAPQGLSIDTVIFLNATQATILLSGNVNNPVEVSVTIHNKVLNSFDDLTTSQLTVGLGFSPYVEPKVVLFATQSTIYLKCSHPKLLGDKIEVFNLSGQQIKSSKIEQTQLNCYEVNILPGIYLCKFWYDGKMKTQRVVFIK